MSKNYIGFVNDHSGSMAVLAEAAIKDYNANIKAIKDAATKEMLDTVVSVSEVGSNPRLSVMVSNPHVLKKKTDWETDGNTPLWSGTANLIKMLTALPDANKLDVSFLVLITTDGEATDGVNFSALQSLMKPLLATGRWTFVARVPKGIKTFTVDKFYELGIPQGNIQLWETTAEGMATSTVQTTTAMANYFTGRSAGNRSTGAFYADASQVNVAALEDVSKKVSLYVVPAADNGIEIRDFVLRHRMEYLKGAAFYQLTKTESRVAHTKQVLVRDRATGKIFAGAEARKMIGLPTDRNARLHPGDHKNFDLFIQSESVNRKLVGGTGVVYWKELGVPFTEADLAYLQPKPVAAPAPVQLPAVPVSTKPTKSPIPKTPKANQVFFETREDARFHCRNNGISQTLIKDYGRDAANGRRWAVQA